MPAVLTLGASARAQALRQVNLNSQGAPGNWSASAPSISADGRFVAFQTAASNFEPAHSDGTLQVYVRDLAGGSTAWASQLPNGFPAISAHDPSLSDDGGSVAFTRYDLFTSLDQIVVRDLASGALVLASVSTSGGAPDDDCGDAELSGDGHCVVFWSNATNLVPNDQNPGRDLFVRDLVLGTTELVDVSSSGVQSDDDNLGASAISQDGRFVAFLSRAANLVAGDTNGKQDVFVRDRLLGVTTRASVDSAGLEANGDSAPAIDLSADGRFVLFESAATNLVAGDAGPAGDLFLRDLVLGTTELVDVSSSGVQANAPVLAGALSADGQRVVFATSATNLVERATIAGSDVFLRDRASGRTRLVSLARNGELPNATSLAPTLSADGATAVFASTASNLFPGQQVDGWSDLFAATLAAQSPASYCSAQPNGHGCVMTMSWSGTPSASQPFGFELTASGGDPGRRGTLLYGLAGPAEAPFQGTLLCVARPFSRTGLTTSRGAGACSGSLVFDFNALIASGNDPALVAGQPVWAQYWSDPRVVIIGTKASLSDAVYFEIEP